MNVIERATNIITKPSETWMEIKAEEGTIWDVYKSYVIILAAIPAIAQFIGNGIIGYSFFGGYFRFKIGITGALIYSIVYYILSLLSIYLEAIVINALAPTFNSQKNITNAFKSAAYSTTPAWLAGILYIIPPLSPLVLLISLYGIYILYLGLPIMMETPKDKVLGYLIVTILAVFLISVIVGFIVNAIVAPFYIMDIMGGIRIMR
jgi:hypothetical protein